jgi:hypothetical protein
MHISQILIGANNTVEALATRARRALFDKRYEDADLYVNQLTTIMDCIKETEQMVKDQETKLDALVSAFYGDQTKGE